MKTTHRFVATSIALVFAFTGGPSSAQARKTLDIYVVDVEGGNATLFVAPSGESVLIDSGNPGGAAMRDADRIMAAVKDAGLTRIDHLITTHWHGDHYGAMGELASRIPIRHYIDHGPTVQPSAALDRFLAETYPGLYSAASRTIAKPGDTVQMTGVDWRIVTSAGQTITSPLPGARGAGAQNALCASHTPQAEDTGENAQSVGSIVTFGQFRVAHLGDLTWNKEFQLMCPVNRVGTVDLFIVTHHGQPISNAPVVVHALNARAAIMNNGTRKGGQPDAMRVLFSAPGLEDLWQMHFSLLSGQEYTVPGLFIANLVDEQSDTMPVAPFVAAAGRGNATPAPVHNGPAHWIKVSAQPDGAFTITNQRNGFAKTYRR